MKKRYHFENITNLFLLCLVWIRSPMCFICVLDYQIFIGLWIFCFRVGCIKMVSGDSHNQVFQRDSIKTWICSWVLCSLKSWCLLKCVSVCTLVCVLELSPAFVLCEKTYSPTDSVHFLPWLTDLLCPSKWFCLFVFLPKVEQFSFILNELYT